MPLSKFHPAVQNWFAAHFKAPSPPQAEGWPLIQSGRDTLICAPTGSGKTLTAFMACLDALFRQGFDGTLRDETQIVYVSPLKALSNDIQKNLREPLEGIAATAAGMGLLPPQIRVRVRTGDTTQTERAAMVKHPPHILVTTPESLFILLTARKTREMLRTTRTVIIDEIHAVARDKRGAHLSLSLERLDALVRSRPYDSLLDAQRRSVQRIGLSATQRPVELVADFLIGNRGQASAVAAPNPVGLDALSDQPVAVREGALVDAALKPPVAHTSRTALSEPPCTQDLVSIVNLGHLRKVELALEIPGTPLEAVCSHETWGEIYERLTALIAQNRTTLIFVNTRRLCERLAAELSKRLGEDKVTSHHGSLSRAQRLSAEERLKSGELKALVATASLELGIDIGTVDLVCQIGITSSIGTLLQRAGRSGHSLTGISRAKIFVLTREELMTGAALLSAIQRGFLDKLQIPPQPLDILAQQIVAASADEEWNEDELFALVKRSWNYRCLERETFDRVVSMLAEGFSRRRGQKAALIRYDGVNRLISARRGARLAAITSGGAIPDTGDYLVVQEPQGITVGTLNEDFAVESVPGDIFQLGNTSWKILKVEPGRVRVEDAHGQPPSVPFWLGEAPARSDELSEEVSRLREEIERRIGDGRDLEPAIAWAMEECGLERGAAEQLVMYLASSMTVLGALPTCETLVLERFFDESGGMQLVLHAPFGRRVNWAWGLALRKRFCRGFNFELQAAASENALLLSLGPQHSFPLADVFNYLNPESVEELLIQAMLVAPVFQTRWRWDAQRALALLRFSGGKKVPPALMRMRSDDLMAAVFPHAAACPENLEGDREIPDHPLVREVIHDCLHEAMDIDGLRAVLRRIRAGQIRCVARDTTEPSLLAHEILTGKPYTFLDDAPLEERRTQAVFMRRGLERGDDAALGALDPAAIAAVRDEAWPSPRDAGEMHDTLMLHGYVREAEAREWAALLEILVASGRATRMNDLWVATERVPLFQAVYPDIAPNPPVKCVPLRNMGVSPMSERTDVQNSNDVSRAESAAEKKAPGQTPGLQTATPGETPGLQKDAALIEIVRGRMEAIGPATVARLAEELHLPASELETALLGLETQGSVLRGYFEIPPMRETNSGQGAPEWCDRRLLARIHRYTLERLRKEIEPVTAADYMRFLFAWQHVSPSAMAEGPQGVREVVEQLQGYEIPAVAWERDILPTRVKGYDRRWLDALSHSGDVTWGRRLPALPDPEKRHSGLVRLSPIGLYLREHLEAWLSLAPALAADESQLSSAARAVLAQLRQRGAVFFQNLVRDTKRLPIEIETALGELVAFGFVTGDGFGGLRALLIPPSKRAKVNQKQRERQMRRAARWSALRGSPLFPVHPAQQGGGAPQPVQTALGAMQVAGRWSLFRNEPDLFGKAENTDVAETVARTLLRRWGVVFHRVVTREDGLPPWRDVMKVLRRMEARGEVRGGRFVAGFSGEQYALPQAVELLRSMRRTAPDGALVTISGADPLNLAGIITPGDRVAARSKSRIVFRDGVPVAIREGRDVRILEREAAPAVKAALERRLLARGS